ncbi:MAG: hypothetical protein KDA36_00085 [Planctomycetaceae bacterium]|nr:hypothetical protein [Planctomycetaceae bacterium]
MSEQTTVLTEPIDGEGFVDYLTALNNRAAEGVTPENNFEIVFREVMGDRKLEEIAEEYYRLLGVAPSNDSENRFQPLDDYLLEKYPNDSEKSEREKFRNQLYELQSKPWTEAEYPLCAEWLKRNERALEKISVGAKRSRNFCPLVVPASEKSSEGKLMAVHLPYQSERREIVSALKLRSVSRLHSGNGEGSLEDLRTIQRIAILTSQTEHPIEWLSAVYLDSVARTGEILFLNHAKNRPERLREIANEIDRQEDIPSPNHTLDRYSRYEFLEAMTKIYCQPETLKKLAAEPKADSPASRGLLKTEVLDKQLKWGNRQYDEMLEIYEIQDSVKRKEASDKFTQTFEDSLQKRKGNLLLELFTVNTSDSWGITTRNLVYSSTAPPLLSIDSHQRRITRKRMASLAFLIQAHRLERGEYPEELSKLIPDYVEDLPNDEFSGKPLHYERKDQGCILISFGPNQRDESSPLAPKHSAWSPTGDDIVIKLEPPPK